MRDSFIFYRSFYEAIKQLPESNQLELYNAIIEYSLNETELSVSTISNAFFTLVKPQIDANIRRYKNGCKGGATKGNTNAKKQSKTTDKQPKNNLKTTYKQPKNNQKQPNVNDNDNVNEYIKENEKEKKSFVANATENEDKLKKRTKEFYQTLIPFTNTYGKEMVREFYNYWSEPNRTKTKMRFELEKTWDTTRRLITWSNRNKVTQQGNAKGYENKPIETYTITD